MDISMESVKGRRSLRIETDRSISSREKLLTVAFALLLGIAFDYLFYDRELGLSHFVFTTLLIGFFTYTVRYRIDLKRRAGRFVLGVTYLLSVNSMLYTNNPLRMLNLIIVPFLIVIYTILVTNEKAEWEKFDFILHMFERIYILSMMNIFKPFLFIWERISKEKGENSTKNRKNIFIGLVISIPILILVVPLLSSADMMFNYYLSNISDVFNSIDINEDVFAKITMASIVFIYTFSYAWSFKYEDRNFTISPDKREGNTDATILATVLTVVNIVYLIFTMVQFSYLYSAEGTLPQEFTYAEYARRGFFELVTVTIINFIVLAVTMRIVKKDNLSKVKLVNLLLSLMVSFTFNMLISAHYKLWLYEEGYGYTELRIFVHMFMVFMLILFIIALLRIWNTNIPMFKASVVAAITIYIVLNYMNVDKVISKNNVERYYRTGIIDIKYLTMLSYDAVPEIIKLADDRDVLVAKQIREELRSRYDAAAKHYGWMEYNLSRSTARKVLEGYFKASDK